MKSLYLVTAISTGLLILTSCTPPISSPTCACPPNIGIKQPNRNPMKVSFYRHSVPKTPYTVVGEGNISKFNQGGIKRQTANLQEAMRELAAAMGGDAVINIKSDSKSISGTVVAFNRENTNINTSHLVNKKKQI